MGTRNARALDWSWENSRESGSASQVDLRSTMIREDIWGEFQGIWFSFEVPL